MTSSSTAIKKSLKDNYKQVWAVFVAIVVAIALGFVMVDESSVVEAVVVAAIALICMVKWPDITTLLVIFLIYANVGPVAVKFMGVPSYAATAIFLILVIPLIWYIIIRREKIIITPVLQLLLLLGAIYSLSAAFSSDITLATPQLTEFFAEGLLLFFLITNIVRTPQMLKRVVWVLLIAGGLIGGLSLYQQMTKTFDNNYYGFAQVESSFGTGVQSLQGQVLQPRLAGSVGEKNRYGQNMMMLIPLGLFQLWIYHSTWKRILALVLTGLIAVGGMLSFSRGAAVGFVLMIVIMVVLRYIKFSQLLLLLVGVGLIFWLFPQYGLRLTSLNVVAELAAPDSGPALAGADNAVVDRASLMLASALVFKDHPLLGVGPGMTRYYTEDYAKQIGLSSITGNYQPHDLYIGMAADAGIFGLICFLLILFVPLRDLAITRKKWVVKRPDISYLATAFSISLISYMVTGLFLHLSYYRFFYLMLALAVVASTFKDLQESEEIKQLQA
ncbi:MAG: O-antigen ligase family protein [Bacteroidota bacterium]